MEKPSHQAVATPAKDVQARTARDEEITGRYQGVENPFEVALPQTVFVDFIEYNQRDYALFGPGNDGGRFFCPCSAEFGVVPIVVVPGPTAFEKHLGEGRFSALTGAGYQRDFVLGEAKGLDRMGEIAV